MSPQTARRITGADPLAFCIHGCYYMDSDKECKQEGACKRFYECYLNLYPAHQEWEP